MASEGEADAKHNKALDILINKPTFNFNIAQALNYLDDPGVLIEVS